MPNLAAIAFHLERHSRQPMFVQLSDQIRHRIVTGDIEKNSRLPPSRSLAADLGISRSTVVTAYEQLVAEGYIESRPGSGFDVCALGASDNPSADHGSASSRVGNDNGNINPLLSHPGYPDTRLFPARAWARCLARSARLTPESMITSSSPFGDPALRTSIARYLGDWRGLKISPQQVMITAGSIDALETCIRSLACPGDWIGLENPGYQPLQNIAINQGMRIQHLAVGARGAELPQTGGGRPQPKMVVLTPSHQFPLGGAMPPDRRLDFLQWAQLTKAWIIEDDYDSEFRYAGRPIPALASMDRTSRTIYIGTFSKVFAVSLRLGYLIMPPDLIPRFTDCLSRFGVKAALPCQRALANFIDNGDFYRHIRRVRRIYAERRQALIQQLQQKLSPLLSLRDHQAGMLLTATLAAALDDRRISSQARNRGVLVSPLSAYYSGESYRSGLLLGFCTYNETEISDKISILQAILESTSPRLAQK